MSNNKCYVFMKNDKNAIITPIVTDNSDAANQALLDSIKAALIEKVGAQFTAEHFAEAEKMIKTADHGVALDTGNVYLDYTYNEEYVETAYLEVDEKPTAWGIVGFEADAELKYIVIVNDPEYFSGVVVYLYNDPELAILDIAKDVEKRDPRNDPTHWEIYEIDTRNKTAELVQALAADSSLDGRWGKPNYYWKEDFGGAHKNDASRIALHDLEKKRGKNPFSR